MTTYHYQDHPIAALFPLMTEPELQELAKDIGERGQSDPIILYQNMILDGRNRYRACLMAGHEPRFKMYIGTDPVRDVLSWNLRRRHLDVGQRALVAQAVLPMLEAQARERQKATLKQGDKKPVGLNSAQREPQGKSAAQAAALVGVSGDSVKKAKAIAAADPELADRVRAGDVSLNAAAQVVKQRKQEGVADTNPPQDFTALVVCPDWSQDWKTLKRMRLPEPTQDAHMFLHVPHEHICDGISLVYELLACEPSAVFTLSTPEHEVDGVRLATDFMLYIPLGEPSFEVTPSTMSQMTKKAFYKALHTWIRGTKYIIGDDAEGFTHWQGGKK